jgi:alkylation response protein AidB-like acyl-CoA dehydrogenase
LDFEFTAEQQQLRDNVRRFLEEAAPIAWVRERLDDDRGTTDAVWAGLVLQGLPGLLVPEAYGGAALGAVEMGVVLEEMGRAVHPGPFLASAVGATRLIVAAGSEAQRKELLPALADGSRVAALGVHEPGSRYGWSRPATHAREAGGGWRVSGRKSQVLGGACADWLLVTATSDSGLACFVVERDAPGVEATPEPTVDGTRNQATLLLRETPARRLAVRHPLEALSLVADALAIGLCADGLGAASRALELSVAYANEREQFGVPIGSFQAVKHLLVDMLRDVELARAGTYYALWALDAAAPHEQHRAAAMAKAFASETLPRIGADAIQIFGGVGFTWEYDIHLYYKRLLSLRHCWGDAGVHLEELARMVVDGPEEEGGRQPLARL